MHPKRSSTCDAVRSHAPRLKPREHLEPRRPSMTAFYWIMIGVSIASCLLVLFLRGRPNDRVVRRDWELLLTPKGEKVYDAIEGRVRAEMEMADLSFEHAFVYRELGTTEEALRLLDVGYRVIEKFAPD